MNLTVLRRLVILFFLCFSTHTIDNVLYNFYYATVIISIITIICRMKFKKIHLIDVLKIKVDKVIAIDTLDFI